MSYKNAFDVVSDFEKALAEFAGSKFAVAVDSCTNALFLCCSRLKVADVVLPAKTYVSVPMSVLHAGGSVTFEDRDWTGIYQLSPYPIFDGAKRFCRGMYQGGLHCLSFHVKKSLCIGKGGAILTDNADDVEWFKQARYEGRHDGKLYTEDRVEMLGWNMYMQPEQAARGLLLLQLVGDGRQDQTEDYPDLRDASRFPVFAQE